MLENLDDARDLIRKELIRMVDLKFSDLWGRWHHVTIPSAQLDDRLVALEELQRLPEAAP